MTRSQPPPGYHGRYLRIDVTDGSVRIVELSDAILRQYVGGSGLGTYLLFREGAAEYDPLTPPSPLAFVFSPLVGSPLTTSAKFAVVSRSPLTGRINDSLASSAFALAGKRCGADAIVLVGRAAEPTLLLIDNGHVQLRPAGPAWGMTCAETQTHLQQYGRDYQSAVIGPAGENRVLYATISHKGRHAGRGGSGAVLGAKNIKALLVRGDQRTTWADPQGLIDYAKRLSDRSFGPATAKYRELGTASNLLVFNRLHALPTRNFQQGSFDQADQIAPETFVATRRHTRASCTACTIGCEHLYSLNPSDDSNPQDVRLEYENLFALGPLCGIGEVDVVLAASRKCDEWGLDTISTGGTIAFAMECSERGWLHAPGLRFGASAELLNLIDQIALRRGLGDQLSLGSRRLGKTLGPDALAVAPQVKGLELPGYEPRALQTMALGFAVGTRGADHNRSGAYEVDFSRRVNRRHVTPETASLAVETEDKAAVMDSLILCKFLRAALEDLFAECGRMLQLVTGWEITEQELHTTAHRIVTAKKLFNIRTGWTPAEDTLPERMLTSALPDDQDAKLPREQLAALIRQYNKVRGWSDEGYVPDELVRELGLDGLTRGGEG